MWILLKKDISKEFKFEEEYTYLIDVHKLNIIVGQNNSGKTYFMREIIKNTIDLINKEKIKDIIFNNSSIKEDKIFNLFRNINEYKIYDKYYKMLEQIELFDISKEDSGSKVLGGGTIYKFNNFEEIVSKSPELVNYLELDNERDYRKYSDYIIHDQGNLINKIKKEYINKIKNEFDKIKDESIYQFGNIIGELDYIDGYKHLKSTNIIQTYILIMRGIRHPLKDPKIDKNNTENYKDIYNDIYKERIIKEYDFDSDSVNIYTGLDFYNDYKRKLLGTKKERDKINEFEKFLSQYFFEGKEISIVPNEETFEIMINIDNQEDYFIYEVGDGITSLIIIIYNLFIANTDKLNILYIEEPEQNFHPGFQRLLLNMIMFNNKFKNFYFYFTTHSNHMIDISSSEFNDFQNYLCMKENDKINIKVKKESDIKIMEELGVKPSSVQIANKVIWIEGKYDALYIRLLLNKKNENNDKPKYIEDYDYVFLPYGGSNGTLIKFTENNNKKEDEEFILNAKKINSNMLIIMDDDNMTKRKANSKKYERYMRLAKELGDKLYKLQVREIENLFPTEVIKKYFIQGINKSENYNFEFLDEIKYDDYKDKKLGDYLNKLVKKNLGEDLKEITGRENGFVNKGFLYSKSKFYDCVFEWIMKDEFDYEKDIPIETKELINVVEKFIEQ